MNNFEFIAYKSYPQDQYTMGIATVRAYGKLILKFKHVRKKDGGNFFCAHQMQVTDDAEKKNVPSFMLDSRAEEEMLMEFIRENVKSYSINSQVVVSAISKIPKEVAEEETVPF